MLRNLIRDEIFSVLLTIVTVIFLVIFAKSSFERLTNYLAWNDWQHGSIRNTVDHLMNEIDEMRMVNDDNESCSSESSDWFAKYNDNNPFNDAKILGDKNKKTQNYYLRRTGRYSSTKSSRNSSECSSESSESSECSSECSDNDSTNFTDLECETKSNPV